MENCSQCHGTKTINLTVYSLDGGKPRCYEQECPSCSNSFVSCMPENDICPYEWCTCENQFENDNIYYGDGQHEALWKHHYRCQKCGKIVQIG